MKHRRLFLHCILALLAGILTGPQLAATVPDAPAATEAVLDWYRTGTTLWKPVVKLKWEYDTTAPMPQYFNIYHADGVQQDYTGFDLLQRVDVHRGDTNSPPQLVSLFYYNAGTPEPGPHSYYVDAHNTDGAGASGAIVSITVPDTVSLNLDSYPNANTGNTNAMAIVGEEFTYTVRASTWSNAAIRYHIAPLQMPLPAGMSIDEETGVLTWTPTTTGVFMFRVQATLDGYPGLVAEGYASINVNKCAGATMIRGTVKDQSGEPIQTGNILVFPTDTGATRWLAHTPIVNGEFAIAVDDGTYLVYADGSSFLSEYYLDAVTPATATPVEVQCGQTVEIAMEVRLMQHFTVSGRVADANGEGLDAAVLFTGYDHSLPANKRHPHVFSTNTLAAQGGYYTLQLPDHLVYIASASVGDTSYFQNGHPAYIQTQFYDHVSDPTEAEEIVLTGDLDNINFDFEEIQTYDNSISGHVTDANGALIAAHVVAFRISGNNGYYSSTTITGNGTFALHNLHPGRYILYAVPADRAMHAAGYYVEGGLAVPLWGDATRLTVGAQTDLTDIEIALPGIDTSAFGGGSLNGSVNGSGGTIGKGDGEVLGATAVAGAQVTLLDGGATITRYDLSSGNGAFSLKYLPAGTYTIIIDKIGFKPYTSTVTISDDEPVKVDVTLEAEVVTSVDIPADNRSAVRAFPNPADRIVTLSFAAVRGTALVSLVNSSGVEVLSQEVQTLDGDNTVTLDTRALPTGAYYARIDISSMLLTLPVQIVR